MTKTTVILTCLCACLSTAQAQQNHLKLYLGFELAQRPELQLSKTDNNTSYTLEYLTQPLFALGFAHEKSNGNFWELSGQSNAYIGYQSVYDYRLIPDSIPQTGQFGKLKNSYAQVQYEYNWLQGGDDDRKVKTYLGLFLRASSQWASYRPGDASYYPVHRWNTSISPGFVPRILLKAGNRCKIDLSAPIVLGYFGYEKNRVENPALTPTQQRNSIVDLSMLNMETQLRLGITYSLTKAPAAR